LSEVGAEQMLLDTIALKSILSKMVELGSSAQPSATYFSFFLKKKLRKKKFKTPLLDFKKY
jgi:hypothetical protein